MNIVIRKNLLLLLLILIPSKGFPLLTSGTDVFFSGTGYLGFSDILVRSHTYLYFGNDSFGMGPVFNYNRIRKNSEEYAAGFGISYGDNFFVELVGLAYRLRHHGLTGEGSQGQLIFGWKLTKNLRLSFPITYTSIDRGDLDKQWKTTVVPHFGVRFSL